MLFSQWFQQKWINVFVWPSCCNYNVSVSYSISNVMVSQNCWFNFKRPGVVTCRKLYGNSLFPEIKSFCCLTCKCNILGFILCITINSINSQSQPLGPKSSCWCFLCAVLFLTQVLFLAETMTYITIGLWVWAITEWEYVYNTEFIVVRFFQQQRWNFVCWWAAEVILERREVCRTFLFTCLSDTIMWCSARVVECIHVYHYFLLYFRAFFFSNKSVNFCLVLELI